MYETKSQREVLKQTKLRNLGNWNHHSFSCESDLVSVFSSAPCSLVIRPPTANLLPEPRSTRTRSSKGRRTVREALGRGITSIHRGEKKRCLFCSSGTSEKKKKARARRFRRAGGSRHGRRPRPASRGPTRPWRCRRRQLGTPGMPSPGSAILDRVPPQPVNFSENR